MATDLSALWPASAHVKLFERPVDDPERVGKDPLAHAVVSGDSELHIVGLEDGPYWAVVDGGPPVVVSVVSGRVRRVLEDRRTRLRPTGDGDVIGDDGELVESLDDDTPAEGRDQADTLVQGDPKALEAPVSTRDIVSGPRTSANTRVKAKAAEKPEKSLVEKVKGAAKRGS